MPRSITVVLIEEDDNMRAALDKFLTIAGMDVRVLKAPHDLDGLSPTKLLDAIILSVSLSSENAFAAATRLRARSNVGIIMLTACAEERDRLLCLSMGVDYCLSKPVVMRELECVIRNLARRAALDIPIPSRSETPCALSSWTLDTGSWRLSAPGGGSAGLSAAEYQLILPLLNHPGTPNSREAINARLGKPHLDLDNRSLDVLVSRLRRKIEAGTGSVLPLRSARGSGYVFTGPARIIGPVARRVELG